MLGMFDRNKIFYRQYDAMDCGATCLKMISKRYGKEYELAYLREISYIGREGVSLLNLGYAAEKIGFRSLKARLTLDLLVTDGPLPCILHWNQNHFVVLQEIMVPNLLRKKEIYVVADPAHGIVHLDKEQFCKNWISTSMKEGVALFLEPTIDFYNKDGEQTKVRNFKFLYRYLKPHYRYLLQFILGMLASSIIALAMPFLTQVLIDHGVGEKNYDYVYLILFSQMFLFFGAIAIEMVQNWLMLHINTRISLNIISDFLIKLLRLPIKYFDTKTVGDISQRINDHHRIETFLTGVTLQTLFSFINIIVFSLVLAIYNFSIVVIFWVCSLAALGWVLLFQKRRKVMDYKRFRNNKENQDKLTEMVSGMQEIKLYGVEKSKRWEWELLQIKGFKLNMSSLSLEQYQKIGYVFFSQFKNIIITFLSARLVIEGEMSLGMLLSVSYIIGQTNGPIEQMVEFVRSAQDASLSIKRMNEVHQSPDEQAEEHIKGQDRDSTIGGDILIEDLSFQYEGPKSPFVLRNINLNIKQNTVTAIVGASGSGKSTLLKLLLGYYNPTGGRIMIGNRELKLIDPPLWRSRIGAIMQDSYIFSDTIARNIALDDDAVNHQRIQEAVHVANIAQFIKEKPLGFTTRIGNNGVGISGGQRQRLFIARVVYRNPAYIFLDEATSSLDANNEKEIMEKMDTFFTNRTVLIIAHRLSTVKNADQIIVLDQGSIAEQGTHNELIDKKGMYYTLVKNQLELGN